MFTLIAENIKGNQLRITQREDKYQLDSVTGLNPPAASISLTSNVGDGDEFQHSRTGRRNIVINLHIKGLVEENRLDIYKVIQTGKYIKLYISNKSKNVWIEGYVESNEVDNFTNDTICQISVLCPDPWFKDVVESINAINTVQPKFHFPFAIVNPIPFSVYETIQVLNLINEGNVASGMTIEIAARGTIVNPIVYNRETTEFIGLGTPENPYIMEAGDKIVITTHPNNKKIKLVRNAVETNIFNYLTPRSTFLQVTPGDNVFTYSADDGNEHIDITFKHYSNYEGI